MTYPVYVIAPTKATWMNGAPLPAQYLSFESDAQAIAAATGAVLANGVDFFRGTIAFALDASDPRQPWVLTLNGDTTFAGVSVAEQNGPNNVNGGGINNPGSWQPNPTRWVPLAPPPPPPPSPPPTESTGTSSAAFTVGGISQDPFETAVLASLAAIRGKLGV